MDAFNGEHSLRMDRVGFHYFPDTIHFREYDLQTWLPRLKDLGASWLVLQSAVDRAIPEHFLQPVAQSGIEPIIQFNLPLTETIEPTDLEALIAAYARWGARYLVFYDRPNTRSAWNTNSWTQQNLVERFLDQFVPLADLALEHELIPVFPALEPGGNYWDTTFLRTSLEALENRKKTALLETMVYAAYGWTYNRPLNWGCGGPARWIQARPYNTPMGEQDQRGFRTCDWYSSIVKAVLDRPARILLFQTGLPQAAELINPQDLQPDATARTCLAVGKLLASEEAFEPADTEVKLEPLSEEVISANFWLLSAGEQSAYRFQAWVQGERILPVVQEWRRWLTGPHKTQKAIPVMEEIPNHKDLICEEDAAPVLTEPPVDHPIAHYLLLPAYDWGVSDWHLDVIRPFIKRHTPTVGFSLEEATLAKQVTVIGNETVFSDASLELLREKGSKVERISGDGMNIATTLAER